jgi:hypothetical protein
VGVVVVVVFFYFEVFVGRLYDGMGDMRVEEGVSFGVGVNFRDIPVFYLWLLVFTMRGFDIS